MKHSTPSMVRAPFGQERGAHLRLHLVGDDQHDQLAALMQARTGVEQAAVRDASRADVGQARLQALGSDAAKRDGPPVFSDAACRQGGQRRARAPPK